MLSYEALRDLLDILSVHRNGYQGACGLAVLNGLPSCPHLDRISSAYHRVSVVIRTDVALDGALLSQLDLSRQLLLTGVLVPGVRVQSSQIISHVIISNFSFDGHIRRYVSRFSNSTFQLFSTVGRFYHLDLV